MNWDLHLNMCCKKVWNFTSNHVPKHSRFTFIQCWLLLKDISQWIVMQEELSHTPPPKCESFQGNEEISTSVIKFVNSKITNQLIPILHLHRDHKDQRPKKNLTKWREWKKTCWEPTPKKLLTFSLQLWRRHWSWKRKRPWPYSQC